VIPGEQRDRLADDVQRAQVPALHRALDRAWYEGYQAGLAQVETAVYGGQDVLFRLLRPSEEVHASVQE
jgi:hypothetical protein